MIFSSMYTGQRHERYKKSTFESFELDGESVCFVKRSLRLSRELYCRWTNSEREFFLLPVTMKVAHQSLTVNEELLELLFNQVQFDVAWRSSSQDKSIAMVWNTIPDEMLGTIYHGYLLVRCDTFNYVADAGRDGEVVVDELERMLNASIRSVESLVGKAGREVTLDVEYSCSDMLVVSLKDTVSVQEGFRRISVLAATKSKYMASLFRVRYGFTPIVRRKAFDWRRTPVG